MVRQHFLNLMGDLSRSESTVLQHVNVAVESPEENVVLAADYANGCLHIVPEGTDVSGCEVVQIDPSYEGDVYWIASRKIGFIHNYKTQFYTLTVDGGFLTALVKGAYFVGDDQVGMNLLNYSYTGKNDDLMREVDRDHFPAFYPHLDACQLVQYSRHYYDQNDASSRVMTSQLLDNGYFEELRAYQEAERIRQEEEEAYRRQMKEQERVAQIERQHREKMVGSVRNLFSQVG